MTPYTWPSVHYGHPHDPFDSAKHRFRRFHDRRNLLNNDVTNNYGRAGTPCSSEPAWELERWNTRDGATSQGGIEVNTI